MNDQWPAWEDLPDGELERQALEAASRPAGPRPPDTVDELIGALTAEGWLELETLVAVSDGAPEPTVMEWCGLAIRAMPMTSQGRARGDDFEKALARIAAPGIANQRSALARMKAAAEAWRKRVDAATREEGMNDVGMAFADPEPASAPLPFEEIAERIGAYFERWISAPFDFITAMVIWAIGTWGLPPGEQDARTGAMFYPYLRITSIDPNSGKTTALQSLRAVVRRPYATTRISPSALFRIQALYQPTLVIDEVGRFIVGDKDLEGLLDVACYRHGTVTLSEKRPHGPRGGETFVPQPFRCFGPIVLGGLGKLSPTVRSRSIRIRMQPAPAGRERVSLSQHAQEIAALREWVGPQLAAHADAIAEALERGPRSALPEDLHNRNRDVWSPLFAVAELIGGPWLEDCRAAYLRLHAPRKDEVTPVRDALDALQAFQEARKASYDAAARGELAERRIGFGPPERPYAAAHDALIPLDVVPVRSFREWLGTSPGGEFAIATASAAERPLSEKQIYRLLDEAEIYPRRFTKKKGDRRIFVNVFDLKDLERAWAEQRGE